ncbi:hypothetical protein PTTG_11439, partial [Puccinia triticina 1-1 BBBD Race 1]
MGELSRAEAIGLYRNSTTNNNNNNNNTTNTTTNNNNTRSTRRPRAGTLPSSFTPAEPSPSPLRQYNPPSNPLLPLASPAIFHQDTRPDTMNLQLSLDKTRARAGTVALPPSSASSYFGRGVFATNFVPRSTRMNEELRSIRSDDSALAESEDPDEAGHVRTLDYLGLDADSPVSPTVPHHPQSAFVGGSGFYHLLNNSSPNPAYHHHHLNHHLNHHHLTHNQQQANPSLSALASRMRASTISGIAPSPASLRRQSNALRPSPFPTDDNPYSGANSPSLLDDDYAAPLGSANSLASQYASTRQQQLEAIQAEVHDKQMSAYSALLNSTSSNGLLAPISRPRANTLGGASLLAGMGAPSTPLGYSAAAAAAAVRNRAGTLAGFSKHSGFLSALNSPSQHDSLSSHNINGINYNWMAGSRPITPDFNIAGIIQQPSRSLWIGNFDPSTTAQELMNVFAVYGPIESLRLLPDKECGFINFLSMHDAAHAKDDIVNRLEGQINLKNGPTCIRIGFGKPESAPQTPATLLTTPIGSARGGGSSSGGAGAGGGSVNGLSQAMMMLSLTNIPGPNGIVSSTQINNICPNPAGFTNVGGVMLGPNGDPVLQSSPTRALWVGSIPSQTTPNLLMDIFSPYGAIESVRVLSHKNCGFINFEHLDDAVRARKALSGREILGSEVGAVKIGYAKVPVKAPGTFSPSAQLDGLSQDQQLAQQQLAYETLARIKGASAVPLDQQILSGSIQDYRSNLAMSFIPNGIHALNGFPLGGSIPNTAAGFPLAPSAMVANESGGTSLDCEAGSTICTAPLPPMTEMQLLLKELSREPLAEDEKQQQQQQQQQYDEEDHHQQLAAAEFRPPVTYYTTVPPPINQLDPHRRLVSAVSDPARLREIRKRFDSNSLSQEEMDQIASELLEEIIYLSSDYIGNTIVQKLFEKCSHPIKMLMLERCAPHLAIIGCHKNGT